MTKKTRNFKKPIEQQWKDARRICKINSKDIELAKSLNLTPQKLIAHAPNPKQKWKVSVKEYIRRKAENHYSHLKMQEK